MAAGSIDRGPGAGRQVLVTGASSGFGLATALHLARLGFDVVGLVRNAADAAALSEAAAERRLRVRSVVADLADPDARATALDGLTPWALVSNAGYMDAGAVLDVPLDEGRRQLEVMVVAPVDLARRVVPAMRAAGGGRIVHVTSAGVHVTTPLTGWYTASKAALRQLNDALREELAGSGVAVVDIEPGAGRTAIWGRAAHELRRHRGDSPRRGLYDRVLPWLRPLRRLMPGPEHVARAVAAVLLADQPPRHRRVGPDAAAMRVLSEVVPDRWWDRLMAAVRPGG